MGCSESTPIMQQKTEKKIASEPASKPKTEDPLHFLIGQLGEE